MKPKIAFEDGSFVEWEDRESVRYTEDGREALIWVDWEPAGWFSSVRIVKADSVDFWGSAGSERLKSDACGSGDNY